MLPSPCESFPADSHTNRGPFCTSGLLSLVDARCSTLDASSDLIIQVDLCCATTQHPLDVAIHLPVLPVLILSTLATTPPVLTNFSPRRQVRHRRRCCCLSHGRRYQSRASCPQYTHRRRNTKYISFLECVCDRIRQSPIRITLLCASSALHSFCLENWILSEQLSGDEIK